MRRNHSFDSRGGPLNTSEILYNSFGFVDVSEQKAEGDFPLRRSKSFPWGSSTALEPDAIWLLYKHVDNRLQILERELSALRVKMTAVEENKSRWGVKYSRRIAILANLLLGVWLFWSHFLQFVQRRKGKLLQNMVMRPGVQDTLNSVLWQAWWRALNASWAYFVSMALLTSNTSWKRSVGLLLSSLTSLYFALHTQLHWLVTLLGAQHFVRLCDLLPGSRRGSHTADFSSATTTPSLMTNWTNYFNLFANLMLFTALWSTSKSQHIVRTKTIHDYILPEPLPREGEPF
jgi:hypothetical protein